MPSEEYYDAMTVLEAPIVLASHFETPQPKMLHDDDAKLMYNMT